jgi:two-component system, NarL family, nitrate/nitrite response regulator NarL
MEDRPTRVAIVEDHAMVAEGFARILAAEPDLEVVGAAVGVAEGHALVMAAAPDVVLCDQELPDGRGTELAERLRSERSGVKVVLISALAEETVVRSAVDAGCAGVLSKGRGPEELLRAVRAAAAGDVYLSPDAVRYLVAGRQRAEPAVDLTPRELGVLQCLAEGLSNVAIARKLHLSPNTVGNHLQRLGNKLGAHSKLEMLVIALRRGLVAPPPRMDQPGSGPG